jgi:predicted 3-demethylubiquinone-9 3-methyltransferase (glyoxalase superfamily)
MQTIVTSQKITPFLWFNNNMEEAINFYISVFGNGKIVNIFHLPGEDPDTKGKALTATFQLGGQQFMALDGGPRYQFTEAISLFVHCETQAEVDSLWNQLTADGGQESRCGWLKDRFGLSWQIIPTALGQLMGSPDRIKAKRVMDAMLQMSKIDIATLQKAHDGDG